MQQQPQHRARSDDFCCAIVVPILEVVPEGDRPESIRASRCTCTKTPPLLLRGTMSALKQDRLAVERRATLYRVLGSRSVRRSEQHENCCFLRGIQSQISCLLTFPATPSSAYDSRAEAITRHEAENSHSYYLELIIRACAQTPPCPRLQLLAFTSVQTGVFTEVHRLERRRS